jgi:LmbE family N-acetylglucosaminyl deacetylase
MVVGAHPDDHEFGCAATIAKWASMGRAAAMALGAQSVTFLHQPDGMLENTMELRRQLCGLIREMQPDVMLAIDPWRRYQLHPDHRAAGQLALDAAWAAREWYLFPEQLIDREPWRLYEVYLYWTDDANHWEDVSEHLERRLQALVHHASQVGDRMENIAERIRKGAAETGGPQGMQYAEGFHVVRL